MHTKKKRLFATALLFPALIIHMFVIFIPSLSSLYYSMTGWTGINTPTFVAFKNYIEAFTDKDLLSAFLHNLIWLLLALTIPIIIGLLVALLVKRIKKLQMFFRTAFFMPYVLSSVVVGQIFSIYYNPFGGINSLFDKLGLTTLSNINWLGKGMALVSVFIADTWHWWGFIMVIMLSALHQVDESLYEACKIDGGNSIQRFFHITIPQIMPTLVTIITLITIWSFVTYDYIWVMTSGGPAGATEVISTYVYTTTFVKYRAGYSSAINVLTTLLCVFIYIILRKFILKKVEE